MAALYVTSPTKGTGKTAICAGLAKLLTDKGKKVGYFKPFISQASTAAPEADNDTCFFKQLLSLDEPIEQLRPAISWSNNLAGSLKDAYARVSQGKDVVLIEGQPDQHQLTKDIAAALNARVLVIQTYQSDQSDSVENYKRLGQALVGVVLNKIPRTRVEQTTAEATARLKPAGITLLGVLPEDRGLLSLTVGELAASIGGEIISGAEKSTEIVENLMLQALGLDPGPLYFSRKANKAAILRADRPDTQLAALETSTRCLVLAGETKPMPIVLGEAGRKNVAIITAKDGVPAILPKVEAALTKAGFNQSKLPRVIEAMEKQLDLQKIFQGTNS